MSPRPATPTRPGQAPAAGWDVETLRQPWLAQPPVLGAAVVLAVVSWSVLLWWPETATSVGVAWLSVGCAGAATGLVALTLLRARPRVRIDQAAGTVSASRWGRTSTHRWSQAIGFTIGRSEDRVELTVCGPDAPDLAVTLLVPARAGTTASLSPSTLRVLAAEIEAWSPAGLRVVRQLRAQADHLACGGGADESPLARAFPAH